MLHHVEGDIFEHAKSGALAHCVSADFAMGAGIALEFRNRFGFVESLKEQQKSVGDVAHLCLEQAGLDIFYLVTKKCYWHKPRPNYVRLALGRLRNQLLVRNIGTVHMPRICCGIDQMQWADVEQIITDVFKHTGIEIVIYTKGHYHA